MKSLHLVKTSDGASWAYRLMRDLVEMGEEVHVALPGGGKMVGLYEKAGVTVHELEYSLTDIYRSCTSLRTLVQDLSPDIIHSHFVLTTFIMRLALMNDTRPRVFEVPGPLHLEHFLPRTAELLLARKNDYWIATCRWSYEKYIRMGVKPKRLFLTYYGNDIAQTEYQKGKLREELHLADDDFIVGMVAYMYAPKWYLGQKTGLKGHEDFIDAVSELEKRYPQLHSVCIGGAWNGALWYEKRIRRYAERKCRRMHILGVRDNVAELYQDVNIAVHPSHSENLGGAAESLSLGVPTIATAVGGFPDIVIDGYTGLLVDPHSPHQLANSIACFINNYEYAGNLAENGRNFVSGLLDSRNTSREVYDIYRKIRGHYVRESH